MCVLCLRLILANHTDPVTGVFTGLDLSLAGTQNKKVGTSGQGGSSEPESSNFESAEPPGKTTQ
jgi:hypothetical protein